jgi:hypothetical protein
VHRKTSTGNASASPEGCWVVGPGSAGSGHIQLEKPACLVVTLVSRHVLSYQHTLCCDVSRHPLILRSGQVRLGQIMSRHPLILILMSCHDSQGAPTGQWRQRGEGRQLTGSCCWENQRRCIVTFSILCGILLQACGGNVERAGDWLFSHMDDLDSAVAQVLSEASAAPAAGEGGIDM